MIRHGNERNESTAVNVSKLGEINNIAFRFYGSHRRRRRPKPARWLRQLQPVPRSTLLSSPHRLGRAPRTSPSITQWRPQIDSEVGFAAPL